MVRFIQEGRSIDYTPVAAVAAGAVVKIGNNFFGVALRAIAAGELGSLRVEGVVEAPKGSGTIASGAICFWDADNEVVTITPVANGYLGRAAATSSGTTVPILLNGTNLGTVALPEAQTEPTPTAADVTPTVTDPAAATNVADVTVTGTYADDDDNIATAINANRADVAALITGAANAKADIASLATNLNKINDDLAAVVAALKTAGLFE